ncbi:hypothetical protein EDF22_0085 [Rathayibacter sp. PhB127]|uniref:hypothetical protein n=1 Tax=Rathayibacter sp. PhB127 TaxID=2485176 RepID=UPI000F4C2769|nr:hypothetical protein [Rathayibacter sp. PhB127]ROS28363.1 hypothetical protein EDF22_0085 [Rathayibacter sp. PhB127]
MFDKSVEGEVIPVNASEWPFYEQHFSSARLRHYLAETEGDLNRARALYEWNVTTSAAFWESLGHLEVGLRNAIDARMALLHRRRDRTGHWVFDDARELGRDARGPGCHRQPYTDVSIAIGRVRRNGKPIDPGQVISEVSFGFWHQMVSKARIALWPDLAAAFPSAPNRSQATVREPVARLRGLRNRIGHHHRIWSLDLPARYDDLIDVTGYIDPELRNWIHERSRVPSALSARP